MASITEQTVNDGFMRGVDAGVSVQIGTKAQLRVNITIKAKTVSNVFKELQKHKQDFRGTTWENIEKAHARGEAKFFYMLLGISAGGSYDYENKTMKQDVDSRQESQAVAQAFLDTDEDDVSIQ